MDLVGLLASTHSACLRQLSLAANEHYNGLFQATKANRLSLSARTFRRLRHLDVAYHVARHTTQASCDELLAAVTAQVVPRPRGTTATTASITSGVDAAAGGANWSGSGGGKHDCDNSDLSGIDFFYIGEKTAEAEVQTDSSAVNTYMVAVDTHLPDMMARANAAFQMSLDGQFAVLLARLHTLRLDMLSGPRIDYEYKPLAVDVDVGPAISEEGIDVTGPVGIHVIRHCVHVRGLLFDFEKAVFLAAYDAEVERGMDEEFVQTGADYKRSLAFGRYVEQEEEYLQMWGVSEWRRTQSADVASGTPVTVRARGRSHSH